MEHSEILLFITLFLLFAVIFLVIALDLVMTERDKLRNQLYNYEAFIQDKKI